MARMSDSETLDEIDNCRKSDESVAAAVDAAEGVAGCECGLLDEARLGESGPVLKELGEGTTLRIDST